MRIAGNEVFGLAVTGAGCKIATFAIETSGERNRRGNMGALRAMCSGRRAWFIPAIALGFTVGLAAVGLAAESKSPSRLPELIKLVGLDSSFDYLGPAMKASAREAVAKSPSTAYREKALAGLDPAIDVAFAPETLQRELLIAMEGKLSKADLDVIFAFYKSPLGARMTALENARNNADASVQIKEKAGELLAELKNKPERAEVLRQIEGSLRLAEMATNIAFNLGRATAIGMAAADEKTTVLSPDAIRVIDQALQQVRPAITAQIQDQVWPELAYTYRQASIPELRQYLAFLTSPAGKRFYNAMMPAMDKTLTKAGSEFGHALMRELGKERA